MASNRGTDSEPGQSEKDRADLEEQIHMEHRSIPEDLRQKVLKRDGHRCRIKGCQGRAHNGSAQLLVQQIEQHGGGDGEPDLTDLETRCLRCSVWIAQMPTTEDLRPQIKNRLGSVTLEPNRAEILQYLGEEGPATTGEILEHVNLRSKPGVRQALYLLMALDVSEPTVEERIVVKDRMNQTYGLPWQVPDEHDARGVIPVRTAELQSRILDELVRRLCEQLADEVEDHEAVIAGIIGRNRQQIPRMRQRGEAFGFPFEKWADREESREDPAAIIAAVDALADKSNNLSRQLLSRNIADVYEKNDEQSSADLLRAYAKSEDITPYLGQQSTNTGTEDHSSETDAGRTREDSVSETQSVKNSQLTEEQTSWDLRTIEDASLETEESDGELEEFDSGQGNSRSDGDSDA
ncbi:hypothetical protein [Halovenus salina]|uniref:hypothetical protein n=1 Tax=Halovenus salina TaxID=1510225 RepID=UPI002260CC67|nr:hypothetical protein [Halovenus salina]